MGCQGRRLSPLIADGVDRRGAQCHLALHRGAPVSTTAQGQSRPRTTRDIWPVVAAKTADEQVAAVRARLEGMCHPPQTPRRYFAARLWWTLRCDAGRGCRRRLPRPARNTATQPYSPKG
jgi:hypothetical protein